MPQNNVLTIYLPADMDISLHPHAVDRLAERGVTEEEVRETVADGEQFAAKRGRQGFRRNFAFNDSWRGKHFATKQVEAIAVFEDGGWLVITVVAKYF